MTSTSSWRREIYSAFWGVNGAGKSTTINMLCTLYAQTAGAAEICGYRLGKDNEAIRRKIGVVRQIDAGDVYYFDSLDNKVFLYLEQGVYEVKYKLYEIEEEYANTDFFRASKSVIINLAKVKQFAPDFGGRFEAQMKNGEKLIISRQYVPLLKRRLGM